MEFTPAVLILSNWTYGSISNGEFGTKFCAVLILSNWTYGSILEPQGGLGGAPKCLNPF